MPAGARCAAHANSVNGIAELIAAMPVSCSHVRAVECARPRHSNGSRISAPSASRISTSGKRAEIAAPTRA